jgi:hypothetical protein
MDFDTQKFAISCLSKEGMQNQEVSEDLNQKLLMLQKENF